jgi:hypothetical protein
MQILTVLYNVYADSGYGPQPTSPQLAALAPDALSQDIVARMMSTKSPTDMIAKGQVPDPTKANQQRPPNVPISQWPPLIDVLYITAAGISLYESIPDPANPPATLT